MGYCKFRNLGRLRNGSCQQKTNRFCPIWMEWGGVFAVGSTPQELELPSMLTEFPWVYHQSYIP